jgi:hypothetical protein
MSTSAKPAALWSRPFSHAAAWYHEFFFAPVDPTGLAICRIALYSYLLVQVAKNNFTAWASAPGDLWKPIVVLSWLPGPIQSPELLFVLQWVFAAVLACCAVGIWMRYCAPAALVLGIVCFGLPQCFGKVDHNFTLPVLALGVLAAANSADALSLTAWLRKRRGQALPADSGEYRWPLALVQTLMCLIFFAAGVAKLRTSGLAWAFSGNLQNILLSSFYTGRPPRTTLGLWLAGHPWLCQAVAGGTLFIEITAPLALFSRRYRWVVVPSLIAMQVGIYLMMGVKFEPYLVCYLSWIPWKAWAERLAVSRAKRQTTQRVLPSVPRRAA